MDVNNLKNHALNIRRNIVEMVYSAQSGHPGGSLGAADILTYLYFEEMNVNKENVASVNRDRFILSKGHCSPALYAVLHEAGLLDEDLHGFRQLGSKLQGHPNMNYIDGVDMSTGSLGQGVSCAVGMAIANKLDNSENRVYALCGDGESEPEEKKVDFTGRKVLLAEDNELNQLIAQAILTESGLDVVIANNGEEAVKLMEESPAGTYDIILMDIQMPVMDGYQASRLIRALEDPEKARVPIVAVTANAFEEDRKLALEAGMNGHLAKPYDIPKMLETLTDLMA